MSRTNLSALAERSWRPLLGLATAAFALCGPVHALGHPEIVYYLSLVGLVAGAAAVPLGFWSLRREEPAAGNDGADAAAGHGGADGAGGDRISVSGPSDRSG